VEETHTVLSGVSKSFQCSSHAQLNMEIENPVTLARRLPQPPRENGVRHFATVYGVKAGQKRKRHEICTATDGDSVTIYEVVENQRELCMEADQDNFPGANRPKSSILRNSSHVVLLLQALFCAHCRCTWIAFDKTNLLCYKRR
jgi:hypothetical protein